MIPSLYDDRPFFEKAIQYGAQQGILSRERLEQLSKDAPKGIIQISRYFGTEFLRPELEKSLVRFIRLISLYLENQFKGDYQKAALSLKENSLLYHSKAGSIMLKNLISMPQSTYYSLQLESSNSTQLLDKWIDKSIFEYQAEFKKRTYCQEIINIAFQLCKKLNVEEKTLKEYDGEAESFIRTALLVLSNGGDKIPNKKELKRLIQNKKEISLPPYLTEHSVLLQPLVFSIRSKNLSDYFYQSKDEELRNDWDILLDGYSDDSTLLTLFLSISVSWNPCTVLTNAQAKQIIQTIQEVGWNPQLARDYIENHAPSSYQEEYIELWNSFVDSSESTLFSDTLYSEKDSLSILSRECNIKTIKRKIK